MCNLSAGVSTTSSATLDRHLLGFTSRLVVAGLIADRDLD